MAQVTFLAHPSPNMRVHALEQGRPLRPRRGERADPLPGLCSSVHLSWRPQVQGVARVGVPPTLAWMSGSEEAEQLLRDPHVAPLLWRLAARSRRPGPSGGSEPASSPAASPLTLSSLLLPLFCILTSYFQGPCLLACSFFLARSKDRCLSTDGHRDTDRQTDGRRGDSQLVTLVSRAVETLCPDTHRARRVGGLDSSQGRAWDQAERGPGARDAGPSRGQSLEAVRRGSAGSYGVTEGWRWG